MALTVEALKAHCNVTIGNDDPLLTRILAAATKHVERLLGYGLDDTDELPGGAPQDLEQAVYMLAAHWFENREASIVGVSAQTMPFGLDAIIAEHRRYTFGAVDG